ncbi:hypothetical protein SDC9_74148 [bioreactor metagenome]|uniref:Uncharacterized protein n=1 Tax=bioreactor metagenome TaxID=1076179 RepID=A0A644YGD4_9ZZZZ
MIEEMYNWGYDTTGWLSYASKKRDNILEYEKFYSYEYHKDTLMVELIKFVGKPVYTTKYYYCPDNKLLYKTGLDTVGQKQRMDYLYNDDGLLQEVISTASGNSVKLLDYQYDSLGNPVKIISYHWTDKIDYIEYNKYENNNWIERNQIAFFNNKSRYKEVNSYDRNNNLIEKIVYSNDKFFSHTKYYYNSENLIIRQESFDKKNRLESSTIYTYEFWP